MPRVPQQAVRRDTSREKPRGAAKAEKREHGEHGKAGPFRGDPPVVPAVEHQVGDVNGGHAGEKRREPNLFESRAADAASPQREDHGDGELPADERQIRRIAEVPQRRLGHEGQRGDGRHAQRRDANHVHGLGVDGRHDYDPPADERLRINC